MEDLAGTQLNNLLYDFQKDGVKFLRQGNRLLGDEAGCGKTPQLLALTQHARPVLVLTLSSLKYQFQDEIKKFLPGATSVVINGTPLKRAGQWRENVQYYIANYEMLLRDLPFMQMRQWEYIIADESTRLSNHNNKQYKALKQLKSRYCVAATGTAINNSPLDVYGIFEWLIPGLLGNFFKFSMRYIVKDINNIPRGFRHMEELAEKINPYYIRRTKQQVLPELPEKIQVKTPIEMSSKEKKLYNQIRAELLFDIEQADINKIKNISQIQNGGVKLMRLRQLVNSLELIGEQKESSKLLALKELVGTFEKHRKVIIFSEFAEMCKIINREFDNSLMIIGEVDTESRREVVRKFNTDPDRRILIMSAAGAFGLNLQAADTIVHFDLPWSISKYEQRAARSHRNGQKNTVYEYSLIVRNSVDEYIARKLSSKQDISEMLMPISELKEILK